MSDKTIKLLCDLIAIDSVNPSLSLNGKGEREIAERIFTEMRLIGMDVEVNEVVNGRPNVVGIIEGKQKGKSLMLCGHTDTVGIEGMKEPFNPEIRNGRIYGRGSLDMKGGVAAIIDVARKVVRTGCLGKGSLIIAAIVDEEYASLGAESLVKHWKADAAVITEPTDLTVAIGHKGFSWVEVETKGRAAHGSRPMEGVDAILKMGQVLARLEKHNKKLLAKTPHPILGTGSLHASLIEGGREMSTYPDYCKLRMERRTITGEPENIGLIEAEIILAEIKREDPEFEATAKYLFGRPPYEIPSDHALPNLLETALEGLGYKTNREGMTFWTDAAILGNAGIPSVVFGPGGAGLHAIEEYVIAEEVITCRDALYELVREFCQ